MYSGFTNRHCDRMIIGIHVARQWVFISGAADQNVTAINIFGLIIE